MKHIKILIHLIFSSWLFSLGLLATPPYNPHPDDASYDGPYRPQFHFSPKSEWMNDVNALIYQDGVYHMIYQWGKAIRHGGYTTSRDLIHWKDEGVALIPQKTFLPEDAPRNVSGEQVYSGSGVPVEGETARKITGSGKPAIIAIYTGTGTGTCLAWSNDNGATWNDYPGNPVANSTEGAYPRDPCVFWYPEEEKWVMALYEDGTTFYESNDFIAWEKLSNFDFGYECPDVFQLPLDGNSDNMKWVLMDARGSYLVGQFDGTHFTKEQDAVLLQDVGPDFYAAQTFYPYNLPEPRLIQIGWLDHWNGGVGEKGWQRSATFPVELGLVTHDGLMKLTRTPLKAIEKLYTRTVVRENLVLCCPCRDTEDPLKGIESKTFDLTVEFDLSDTEATEIYFQLNNRRLRYDIPNQELIGTEFKGSHTEKGFPLKPDANRILKIRILMDVSSLEIFSADGTFSYSEQYRFLPEDHRVGLGAHDGSVKVRRLEFNEVKSIW